MWLLIHVVLKLIHVSPSHLNREPYAKIHVKLASWHERCEIMIRNNKLKMLRWWFCLEINFVMTKCRKTNQSSGGNISIYYQRQIDTDMHLFDIKYGKMMQCVLQIKRLHIYKIMLKYCEKTQLFTMQARLTYVSFIDLSNTDLHWVHNSLWP